MEDLQPYFHLGWFHLMNFLAWDHWVYLLLLVIPYEFQDWKKLITSISLFTLGHTLALFLSLANVFSISPTWIENGILTTIIVTALINFSRPNGAQKKWEIIWLPATFGMIHGLGFGNDLANMWPQNQKLASIFGFAMGLESAQLIGVISILVLVTIFRSIWANKQRDLVLITSGIGLGAALIHLIF